MPNHDTRFPFEREKSVWMYMCGYYICADKVSVGENMEKLKPSYIAGGNWTWCSTVENCLVVPHFPFSLSWIGEGSGTLLPCSCLENPMDGRPWWAAVHGVAKSRTWLSDFTFTFYWEQKQLEYLNYWGYTLWYICMLIRKHYFVCLDMAVLWNYIS